MIQCMNFLQRFFILCVCLPPSLSVSVCLCLCLSTLCLQVGLSLFPPLSSPRPLSHPPTFFFFFLLLFFFFFSFSFFLFVCLFCCFRFFSLNVLPVIIMYSILMIYIWWGLCTSNLLVCQATGTAANFDAVLV